MKKIFALALAVVFGASAFAIDYSTVSTRVLETLTDDEIFVGQCGNEKELELVLEKGYKESFGSSLDDPEKKVTEIIKSLENKKEYDNAFQKAEDKRKMFDVYDYNHFDLSYDEIVQIVNTFKGKLKKESSRYYTIIMKDGIYNAYIFVYDAKSKKVYMSYEYHYTGGGRW